MDHPETLPTMHCDDRAGSDGQGLESYGHCQLVPRRVDELRPHPSYFKHRLSSSESQLCSVANSEFTLQEPIVITRNRKIIDGHARVELARRQGRLTILCIEYDLTDEEALRFLIQTHRKSHGLNDYSRILLALDLEPSLQEKARANQEAGGRNHGSSNLTGAKHLDVRSNIADIAGVSTGNVTKVKQLLKTAHEMVERSLRAGEISIHKAWLWSKESPKAQLENLRIRRLQRGIRRKAKSLVAEHQAAIRTFRSDPPSFNLPELISLLKDVSAMSLDEWSEFGTVDVATLEIPGKGIYLTKELVQILRSQEGDS